MNNSIRFNNVNYTVVNSIVANVADSFVDRQLKRGTGSGETRLYLHQQKDELFNDFFTFEDKKINVVTPNNRSYKYYPVSEPCFFIKSNILEYLDSVKSEYIYSYTSSLENVYNENLFSINNGYGSIIEFQAHNQSGSDKERLYIGSGDDIWYAIRRLALPGITTLTILKLEDSELSGNFIYVFLLNKANEAAEFNSKDFTSFVNKVNLNTITDAITDNKDSKNSVSDHLSISDTEVESLVKSRVGQGTFRNSALKIMPKCPFTGIDNGSLLIASHIKPWSECETVAERLDGYNGLMLSPTYDKVFDLGLISFEDDGKLLISRKLDKNTITLLNLSSNQSYNILNHDGQRDSYLKYHREKIFLK